jgi:hypothetical protein
VAEDTAVQRGFLQELYDPATGPLSYRFDVCFPNRAYGKVALEWEGLDRRGYNSTNGYLATKLCRPASGTFSTA